MTSRVVPVEWSECLKHGDIALRSPHERHAAPRTGIPKLVVWHAPSFKPCHSWAFLKNPRTATTQLFHLVWRQDIDAKRFSDPMFGLKTSLSAEPTIEASLIAFDSPDLTSFLGALESITLPLQPKGVPLGLDGESFGLRLFAPDLALSWWGEGPTQWRQLVSAVLSFIGKLPHDYADG